MASVQNPIEPPHMASPLPENSNSFFGQIQNKNLH